MRARSTRKRRLITGWRIGVSAALVGLGVAGLGRVMARHNKPLPRTPVEIHSVAPPTFLTESSIEQAVALHVAQAKSKTPEKKQTVAPVTRTPAVSESIKPFTIPTKPLEFPEIPIGEARCSQYSRLAAEQLFGFVYTRGDAWAFAQNNQSIWNSRTSRDDFSAHARPGHVLGIFYPSSRENKPGRQYTHTALYLGKRNGEMLVMHRLGPNSRIETIASMLSRLSHGGPRNPKGLKASVMEVISPRSPEAGS